MNVAWGLVAVAGLGGWIAWAAALARWRRATGLQCQLRQREVRLLIRERTLRARERHPVPDDVWEQITGSIGPIGPASEERES